MRLVWLSNGPNTNTGYGRQTALWTRQFRDLGHEVAIVAFYGVQGQPTVWEGIPVYPGSARDDWALDVLPGHYKHFGADAVITLMDMWASRPYPMAEAGMNAAHWVPVDCTPMGEPDQEALRGAGGLPVAMSRFGQHQMQEAGFAPRYVPHGIDTGVFSPPADRDELRRKMGVSDRFVIGMNAANRDKHRKGFPEQFAAFAQFQRKHPEALLLVHTVAENEPSGLDLRRLAAHHGIPVKFCDQYDYAAGLVSDEALASWYGCLDLYSGCSWAEGFGLPIVEAQACGVPVVVTKAASMTELCGSGWTVEGESYWHDGFKAEWVKPSIGGIARAYGKAFEQAARKRPQAREFALQYNVKRVLTEYWEPVLAALEASCASR